MKKKYLSILLVMVMVFTILPGTPVTVSASGTSAAIIGGQGYDTLQAAFEAVTEGQTIRLGTVGVDRVTISKDCNFTVDLNGKTWDSGSDPAIIIGGSGTMTITDTGSGGKITSSTGGTAQDNTKNATVQVASGSAIIMGGTVENNNSGSNGCTINNIGSGSLSVTGGMVRGDSSGNTIYNTGSGSVSVSGGYGGFCTCQCDIQCRWG